MRADLIGQIMRFGVVGTIGFVVDGGMLWLLLSSGLNPYAARALSFPVAVVVTWALNRVWTFATAEKIGKRRQFNRYLAVQLVGVGANYSVYTAVIRIFSDSASVIFAALVAGSFVGMFLNFWGARKIAFRDTH
jgi:putative flippase GtrA